MRIVGGEFGGRRFSPPPSIPARPTTEVAKEGLFNVLCNMIDIEGIKSLDLFAGTGSISYELASRGATDLTLVERDAKTIDFIRQTAKDLGVGSFMQIIRDDVFKFVKRCNDKYNFIFAGPPYALINIDDLPLVVFDKQLLLQDGIFVLEHTPRNNYEHHQSFLRTKNYGTTVFTFFQQH